MDAAAPLAAALGDEEPLVRSHAAWALGRLGGAVSAAALEARPGIESDPSVVADRASHHYRRAGRGGGAAVPP